MSLASCEMAPSEKGKGTSRKELQTREQGAMISECLASCVPVEVSPDVLMSGCTKEGVSGLEHRPQNTIYVP